MKLPLPAASSLTQVVISFSTASDQNAWVRDGSTKDPPQKK